MKLLEIREPSEWRRLESVWNPLLEASASATTFLTWEWVTAWWSAYGGGDPLCILTATDDGGVIRGIAPLRRQTIRRYGRRFSTLAFLGDGSNDSEYLDFIIERGFEERVMPAFFGHCQSELDRGTVLRLNDIPAASRNLPLLRTLAEGTNFWNEQAVPCATVQLPSSWDEYLGTLRPRFRTKVRSVLRSHEGRSDVTFGQCNSESEIERLLPILFDLHTRRWNQEGKPGVFGWPAKREFYADLSRQLLGRGSLRMTWMAWRDRVLACQYGFRHGDTYLHLQEGYEPASEHWNVGVGLRAWTIREFLREGIREYDFLAGVGRHKTDWGADVKESRRIIVAGSTASSLLLCRAPEWTERLKTTVKQMVPAKVLAARRDRLARRRTSGMASPSAREYLRETVARCYFYCGMPAAARLVRERYQVSLSPQGRVLHRSWARRQGPTGRILYYHRVNDEGDPFFPSTPVDVFERQMRFIAHRYKVVSLDGLVSHLESDASEAVVAITFDDGYRDNYDNAFPVLQRHGLPATIFLSTGSLDSREPLWFEVLAGAIKTSAKEFLDIEVDLPRRFWMRTLEERLQANSELFALLRRMPDDERRRRLTALLHELAPADATQRRDMMLTWDQVRHLKKRNIDFGGHTVTHPFLSRLSPDQVTWEVTECKRRIELELQEPVDYFAYPSGRNEDFGSWNKDAIRSAGYRAAVSTIWGSNDRSTDRMELRRGQPWEEDEALFAYKMDWYQLVNG
jgi:peptidoglycan/xylan/chitin deacetylase (PgdA/CDA1 family)/CelD/BcsL family acetyltransferase involved in cellulose biosynthesis